MQGCLIWPVNLQKKEIILKVFLLCCCSALWVIKVSCIRFTPAKIAIYNDLTFLFLKRAKKLMIWMLTSVRFHVRCILLGLVVLWIQEDLEAFQCLFACWIHVILCLHYTCVHIPCKHIFWLIDIKWSGSIPCCPESGSDRSCLLDDSRKCSALFLSSSRWWCVGWNAVPWLQMPNVSSFDILTSL